MFRGRAFFLLAIVKGSLGDLFSVSCHSPLVHDRIDPIVTPGQNTSFHMHTVHGGNAFSPRSTYADLRNSSCTSCQFNQDTSNYWFPRLYFHDPVTEMFEPVANGALIVHYLNQADGAKVHGGAGLTAFPAGFKMVGGDSKLRSHRQDIVVGSQQDLQQRAAEFSCKRASTDNGYDGHGFPNTDCEGGLITRLHMPACWDGENLDSEDHKSHTAYLSGLTEGSCPTTHPVSMAKLLYEVTWDVQDFSARWDPTTQTWPFVYSTGDPTGYSMHGDFQNGWDPVSLQSAVDECDVETDKPCAHVTPAPEAEVNACKIPAIVKDVGDGAFGKLSGCNPLQYGPEPATQYPEDNCPNLVSEPPKTPDAVGNASTVAPSNVPASDSARSRRAGLFDGLASIIILLSPVVLFWI